MTQTLTKIEAAKRQLQTAIELFFNDKDPVSIYTLASNAWELVDSLCNQNNINSISNETKSHIPADEDLKINYINSPYRNYFKHADKDPNEILEGFNDKCNDAILFLATEDYIRYTNKASIELQIYQLWFLAIHPNKVIQSKYKEIIDATNIIYPNIRNTNREKQKMLAQAAILTAKADSELLNNPKTENS